MQHCSHSSLPKQCIVLPVPNDHAWKEKLQLPHLKHPAKPSPNLTRSLQALGSGLMLTVHSCLTQARERRGCEDAFGDVVVTN